MKIFISKKLILTFLLALPFVAQSSVSFSYDESNYRIHGNVDEPVFRDGISEDNTYLMTMNFASNTVIATQITEYCPTEEAAKKLLNKMLAGQGSIAYRRAMSDETYFSFYCRKNSKYKNIYYYSQNSANPAPTRSCKLDIPASVDFGEVAASSAGTQVTLEASVTCNLKSSVALSLTGENITNQHIKVGDADVFFMFENGNATTTVSADKAVKTAFNLYFHLYNSGTAAGKKQASVVLKANWL